MMENFDIKKEIKKITSKYRNSRDKDICFKVLSEIALLKCGRVKEGDKLDYYKNCPIHKDSMKKIIMLIILSVFNSISFAEDIFLVSTKNQCVLIPKGIKNENYLNKISKNSQWIGVKNQQSKKINLNKFEKNTEPCHETIFINENDKTNLENFDFIISENKNLYPEKIEFITDKYILNSLVEKINIYIKQKYNIPTKKYKEYKAISRLSFDKKIYTLIDISTYVDLTVSLKNGDYSGVFLIEENTNNIIEISSSVSTKINNKELIQNPPYKIEIESILDIDSDGEYEIMIKGSYYEGSDTSLYKIVNGKAIQKRTCGCGV